MLRAQCWRRVLAAVAGTRVAPVAAALSHYNKRNGAPNGLLWYSNIAPANDSEIERHYIEHELVFPLRSPVDDPNVEASASIWNKAEKDANKLVEAIGTWMKEGHQVSRKLINALLVKLAARGQYSKMVSLLNWVMQEVPYKITDGDRLLLLHFTATLKMDSKAQTVFSLLSRKSPIAYESLLRAYATRNDRKQAEAKFKRMKNEKLIISAGPYDLMISMYLRLDEPENAKKVFFELEKSGIPPSAFSYKTLDARRDLLNIEGLNDKIRAFLDNRKVEESKLKGREWKNCILLNAAVGREQEVEMLWKQMKDEGYLPDSYYLTAAEAFSKLGDMAKFKEICAELESQNGDIVETQCHLMLKVYSEKGMMEEAEALLKQVSEATDNGGFRSYHYLVAGYLKQGNPTKALEKFHESMEKCGKNWTYRLPMNYTMLLAMEAYAKTMDVEGAEKLMAKLHNLEGKWKSDARLYKGLLKVYAAAGLPVRGFQKRMKDDNVVPDAETKQLLSASKLEA